MPKNEFLSEKELLANLDAAAKTKKHPGAPARQLELFENFKEFFPAPKIKTDDYKMYRFALALFAGKSGVEAYREAYDTKTDNVNTQYVAASRLKKHPKVTLILKTLRERAEEQALMPTTELFATITHMARNSAKDELRLAACREIAKIHGVYEQADGVVADTLVLRVNRAPGAAKQKGKQNDDENI